MRQKPKQKKYPKIHYKNKQTKNLLDMYEYITMRVSMNTIMTDAHNLLSKVSLNYEMLWQTRERAKQKYGEKNESLKYG